VNGPVLLMLHTAGADSRQWHGLMGQQVLREAWDLHAFDLPGHGRSPLPAECANWEWRLTEAQYMQWVLAYMGAAGLARVALMGCSMGSAIALALLANYPERFSGAVLLEAPYHSPGRRSAYLNHPQVHGARLAAAWVGSLLSPTSPKAGRDEAAWIYSQSAPGIYDGDLAFYSDDFNAHEHTARIDTARTKLWLLTGNYDYLATPEDGRRVAAEIPGAHFLELEGFGHFPMVENPQALLPYLAQPLRDLRAHSVNPSLETS
jgi:pimeloyl-ACP methyl ester carboxylesterase